jgi:hypothetical protein
MVLAFSMKKRSVVAPAEPLHNHGRIFTALQCVGRFLTAIAITIAESKLKNEKPGAVL